MKIINNLLQGSNHFQNVVKQFEIANELFIVSPFITREFNFFPFNDMIDLRAISIITTLKPKSRDQYKKVPFLLELSKYAKANNIRLKIYIDNTLHAKIYLSKKNSRYLGAILTSANFTISGLKYNNEWGVEIYDQHRIAQIEESLLKNVKLKSLQHKELVKFSKILSENPLAFNEPKPEIDLMALIGIATNKFKFDKNVNCWLKPIGTSESFIDWGKRFDKLERRLHFSKPPRSVKLNDIIIAYAVGHKNILAIYRVISNTKKTKGKEGRWPYFVLGHNLTPNYGREWHNCNVHLSEEKRKIIKSRKFDITPSGKNSLGSLMRGADKLRITTKFGNHIYRKVGKLNLEIESKKET